MRIESMWPAGQPFFRLVPRFFHALMPRKGTCVPLAPPFFARRRPGGTQTARSAFSPALANASAFARTDKSTKGKDAKSLVCFLMKTGDNMIIKINLYKWDCGPGIEIPCQGRFSQYLQFTILFPFLVLLLNGSRSVTENGEMR